MVSKIYTIFVPNFESDMIYFPNLSIEENAKQNGVTMHAVRQYIRRNHIDRRTDEQLRKREIIIELNKKGYSFEEIVKETGFSPNTVRKYLDNFNLDEYKGKINTDKVSAFNSFDNRFVIRSTSYNQDDILHSILDLYIKDLTFECDLTYSQGVFYRRLEQPMYKFDKFPLSEDVMPLEEAYSLPEGKLRSVVIDLPFIVKPSSDKESITMKDRFGSFNSVEELINTNKEMLRLAHSLLRKGGYLIVKTQDTNYTGNQIWTSFLVQQYASELGFEMEDLFILLTNKAIAGRTLIRQKHARKFHSYFLVFLKR